MTKEERDELCESIAAQIARLRDAKREDPELRVGFYAGNQGSILNAYREGDVSFDEAVALIEALAKSESE